MAFYYQSPILVEKTTFLGVIFDLFYPLYPILKAVNSFKIIGNTEWGAVRKVMMLRLYRSLVRSKLDYGCFVYGSARTSWSI